MEKSYIVTFSKVVKLENYNKLISLYSKFKDLEHIKAIIEWDQQVMMPTESADDRNRALAEYNALINDVFNSSNLDNLISNAKSENLNSLQMKILKKMEDEYSLNNTMSNDFIREKSMVLLKCEHEWRAQRLNNDWHAFSKNLKKVVELSKKEANKHSALRGQTPYDYFLSLYSPGLTSNSLDEIFNEIKLWLPNLIKDIMIKQSKLGYAQDKKRNDIENKDEIIKYFMSRFGFDFKKGRLDKSTHAICAGVPEDVRVTTRLDEKDFLKSFMVAMHELGHALYEQNLPREYAGTPIGKANSMSLHESQSLLYENQICKSDAFLRYFVKTLKSEFSISDYSAERLIEYYKIIKPTKIRVESDEVTYTMHVILRYELEKDLINGIINVEDIPLIWDKKMKEYLNIDTKDDFKNGPMQDIHWTQGIFGYFPSYTIGSIFSTQLFEKIKKSDSRVEQAIQNGSFENIFNWLNSNIWSKGSLFTTDRIMQDATGKKINIDVYKKYLENKYL